MAKVKDVRKHKTFVWIGVVPHNNSFPQGRLSGVKKASNRLSSAK